MKKKLLVLTLILAMIFAFTACGGGGEGEAADSQDSGKSETKLMGESTDLISCDAGALKFVGFQQADPDLTDQDGDYIFVFDYTNFKDDPEICANTFVIQFFQNGSELKLNQYSMKFEPKDQYELIQAELNTALKDGTVQFGHLVVPKDDSPVTIMAAENENRDHYEMIEVNLSDGTVTSSSAGGESDTSADVESLLQGDWVLQEVNTFHFENGAVSLSGEGVDGLAGEYTINSDESTVDAVLHNGDQNLNIHLPYKVEDGVLHLYNNHGEEMVQQ